MYSPKPQDANAPLYKLREELKQGACEARYSNYSILYKLQQDLPPLSAFMF